MKRFRRDTGAGTLVGLARDDELAAALAAPVLAAEREQRVLAGIEQLGASACWLKGDHLPGKARLRHSLRRMLGSAPPRVRELHNLVWLRTRLFRAPQPLVAAALVRGGLLRYQALALAPLPPHVALEDAFEGASRELRAAWLDELARETARLHALHFVHRNLLLRNVLVDTSPPRAEGDRRRLVFVDVWRGGSALPRRDASYDLACLMLAGADALEPGEQRAFVARYAEEREAQGRPVELGALLAAADARRSELVALVAAQPGRWRRARAPAGEWRWRELLPR